VPVFGGLLLWDKPPVFTGFILWLCAKSQAVLSGGEWRGGESLDATC